MKRIPKAVERELEQDNPTLARHLRSHPEYNITLHLEDFACEPVLLFYWAWYAQKFGIRIHMQMRDEPFRHMPRAQAKTLAKRWPELADAVRYSNERVIWFHLDQFEAEPDLLWQVAWYTNSRRVHAEVPWPYWQDRYPLLSRFPAPQASGRAGSGPISS